MAIQLKRQGAANAANCSSSPLKPTGLAYGEPAIDSAGYLYVGDGKGQVVSRTRYADTCGSASTANLSTIASNSNALSGIKIGSGTWNSTTSFIPYVRTDGVMEIGKYIDFHQDQNSTADYNIRLNSSNSALYITKTGGGYADLYTGQIQISTTSPNGIILNSSDSESSICYSSNNSKKWSVGLGTYGSGNSFSFYNFSAGKNIFTISDQVLIIDVNSRNPLRINTTDPSGGEVYFQQNGQTKIVLGDGTGTGQSGTFGVWDAINSRSLIYTDTNGYCHAIRMYNAVYNDYAEFFPRGEDTEPGDIIALDINSTEEKYIKATSNSKKIVGVHSNEYGHLIGGEKQPEGQDFIEYNLKKYIPVGLVGRCKIKVIGKVNKGDEIVPSDIPGVGKVWIDGVDSENLLRNSVGFAVESSKEENIKLVKVKLRG